MRVFLALILYAFLTGPVWPNVLIPDQGETLGKNVPDVLLFDHSGKKISLREIINDKPIILSLIYTRCISSCLLITDNLKDTVEKIEGLGEKFNVLTLSFDPSDTPGRLDEFRRKWGLEKKGWYIAGGDKDELQKLLKAIDFQYTFDSSTGEFIHPNLLVILTPDRRISRYIWGVSYSERDLKLSLINAKKGSSTITIAEGLLLRCYRYNSLKGTYETDWAFIMHLIGGGAFFSFCLCCPYG